MQKPLKLTEEERLNPFSPEGFAARARARGLPLEKAGWMTSQPASYGIDAGRRLDENGNANENLRLLTLRNAHLSAHSGQIAFPGGKIEPGDATPIEAALREAEEEIGLPRKLVTPLSLLDRHNTGTGFRIIPVLALVDPFFTPAPDPNEVADVFEVPLSFLMEEENHMQHLREWKDRRILFYAMEYEQRFIWGATAAMLRNLYERLYAPDVN